ncbi:oxaloacetate decarboxylase [uncultured Robinsoniella sp.]|uniref:oxaloacetate decarboxylase n=1 Tax=uncultured Robinsoniella sp. TaxID=904190 RepID=UPI00374F324A
MKKIIKIIFILLGILGIIGIVFSIKTYFYKQKSITIIGGADGPTSIFIAGKVGNFHMLFIGGAILFAALLGILFFLIRKNKKNS